MISGGLGNDCIFGGSSNDIISGNDGDDVLKGNSGDDVLKGDVGIVVYTLVQDLMFMMAEPYRRSLLSLLCY